MHSWYSNKLNELIKLARYSKAPMIEAHLILTRKCVDDSFGITEHDDDIQELLTLLAGRSINKGQHDVAGHLIAAVDLLEAASKDAGDNVLEVDFRKSVNT